MIRPEHILNQNEAASYINDRGIPMRGDQLSFITNSGGGPRFVKKGNQKIFLLPDVDAWIEQEKSRRSKE